MKHTLLLAFVTLSCSVVAMDIDKKQLTFYEQQQKLGAEYEKRVALRQASVSQNNLADWEVKRGQKPRPESFTFTKEDFTSSDSYGEETPLWEL